MDTGKLKRFATEARNILMKGVKHRLQSLGFDLKTGQAVEMPVPVEGGAVFMNDTVSTDFYVRWMSLYNNVQSRSIKEVAEEAAYTWFNRFMAIRIMAKQGFIAPVLEYESEDVRVPAIVSEARQGRMPQMKEAVRTQLMELLDDDSKTSEQFALLIVAYCHENPIINKCFGAIADYTELLLPQNILLDGGFVDMINHTEFITDEQYASAELIGWLYQFYISDRKDEAFAKKGKYDADEIAPATQIFTPNWIVKYMVENTVGRIYLDNNPYETELQKKWQYLVGGDATRVTQSSNASSQGCGESPHLLYDELADLKVADLACGSGHILNECFDLLYDLYITEGYGRVKAIENIFRHNLTGIDLDTRAKQLATFALLMKACQKDSSFLDAKVMPRVYNMPRPVAEVIPSDWSTKDAKEFLQGTIPHYMLGSNDKMTKEITDAILLMNHADTLGSIMKFDLSEATRNAIMIRTQEYEQQLANGEFVPEVIQLFIPYMHIILALTDKYAAICMNPPYMGSSRFDSVLSKYVKDNYEEGKADLFSVFMLLAIDRLLPNGKYGMINMQSWMFLSSFEKLRTRLLEENFIDNMLHLGPRTFDELSGEVVQNTAFVITNCEGKNAVGSYYRLIEGKNCGDKERMFIEAKDNDGKAIVNSKLYIVKYNNVSQQDFEKIPGCPIGYWVSEKVINVFFKNNPISSYSIARSGFSTGDNEKFVKCWYEVAENAIGFNLANNEAYSKSKYKFVPFTAGGSYRKWYGNLFLVVDWTQPDLMHRPRTTYMNLYYKQGITWNAITSGNISCRAYGVGLLFEHAAASLFVNKGLSMEYFLAYINSPVFRYLLKILNPTLNNGAEVVSSVPIILFENNATNITKQNITISKQDWDTHETSWDFETNPLFAIGGDATRVTINNDTSAQGCGESPQLLLEYLMNNYKQKWEHLFMQLHANEEKLNRQFIEIYGLQDELTPDVPLDEITILQQGEISIENNQIKWHDDVIIKQFISYAVGCMMGRYSIDKPGLILANQGDGVNEYNEKVPNSRFEVDDDGIIPLMASDTDFSDNATLRFKQWLTVALGDAHLVENLNFIEGALGKSLDDYFAKDFWKDHKKMYQNRPIYWLFSSKKGAFQCIAYMHRMNAYTAERIRTKYLLPHIEWLMQKQSEMEENAANLSTAERRKLDSIRKQIEECREYHDRLHVVADEQIAFDLDDGVVVNYSKFGDVLQKIK